MAAVVVDLKDLGVRTPEQVVRVFYELYNADTFSIELLKAFIKIAGDKVPGEEELEVAKLFDHLNGLVRAIEELRSGRFKATNCLICGAEKGK